MLQLSSDWLLGRSATLIYLLEPWWYKRLCGAVVLQMSIWEPYLISSQSKLYK